MDDLEDYFWRKPTEIHNYYRLRMLGYMNIACLAIALPLNILMILVLTKKDMISPINTIFTHYIVTETMCGILFLPRTYHEHIRVELCSIQTHNTFIWETISYYSYTSAFLFRHIGVWLALMLAIWRYVAVIHPLKERQYCNKRTTNKVILVGYLLNILITIPPFFSTAVGPAVKLLDQNGCITTNFTTGKNVTIYEFQIPLENYPFLFQLSCLLYAIFLKMVPSVVMTVISYKLIKNVLAARKHRGNMIAVSDRKNTYSARIEQQIAQRAERTTKIILIVLALFVVGEVPHGIFGFLSGCFGAKFAWKYYYYAMEIFNTFTYTAETFNFAVYYSLSHQFRSTFKSLFVSNSKSRTAAPRRANSSLPDIKNPQDYSTGSSSNCNDYSSRSIT